MIWVLNLNFGWLIELFFKSIVKNENGKINFDLICDCGF